MRFHNYAAEKKEKGNLNIYLKALVIGCILAAVVIFSGIGLKFIALFIIKYWIWLIAIIFGALFLKRFLTKKKVIQQPYYERRPYDEN